MKDTIKEPRVNERIRVPAVRLISAEGEQLGVFSIQEALLRAQGQGLDLVEVSPNANPPVCRLVDYGKYKYQLKKKLQEVKKNQTVVKVKEVKLRPGTEEHDIGFKVKNLKRFLEEGDKARVVVVFRGREMAHDNLGRDILDRIVKDVGELGILEQEPKMEGRMMSIVLAPGKRP